MRSQATLALAESTSSTDLVLRGTILDESQVLAVVNSWAGTRKVSGSQLVSRDYDKENYYNISIPRKAHSPEGESSSQARADIDGQSVRMPMSQYELMTAAKDILSALVQLERKCILVEQKFAGSSNDVNKPRLRAIGSERDRLLVKIHDQLSDDPHPAARSAQKKLAAKYDMTRMRRRAKRYDRDNVLEVTELEVPKEPLHEPCPELDEILKMIFEVWERLDKYFDKAPDEPSYPTILDELCLEFPHAVRHLCTTMPWTIWPALVVLWGVCWMFKPSVTEPVIYCRMGTTSPPSPGLDLGASQQPWSISDNQDSYLLDFDSNPSWFESDGMGYGYEPPKIDDFGPHSSDMAMEMFDHVAVSDTGLLQDSLPNHRQGSSQDENTSSENYSSGEGGSHGPSASEMYDDTPNHPSSIEGDPSLICEQCKESFSNVFTLQRHQAEQHAGGPNRFPCPHPPCKRSLAGHAFKREAHLRRHLESRKHQSPARRVLAKVVSSPSLISNLRPIVSSESRETCSRPPQVDRSQITEESKYSKGDDLVYKWKVEYEAGMKALQAKEQECEKIRQLLKAKELECQKDRQLLEGLAKLVQN